jgi:hypothetical protein
VRLLLQKTNNMINEYDMELLESKLIECGQETIGSLQAIRDSIKRDIHYQGEEDEKETYEFTLIQLEELHNARIMPPKFRYIVYTKSNKIFDGKPWHETIQYFEHELVSRGYKTLETIELVAQAHGYSSEHVGTHDVVEYAYADKMLEFALEYDKMVDNGKIYKSMYEEYLDTPFNKICDRIRFLEWGLMTLNVFTEEGLRHLARGKRPYDYLMRLESISSDLNCLLINEAILDKETSDTSSDISSETSEEVEDDYLLAPMVLKKRSDYYLEQELNDEEMPPLITMEDLNTEDYSDMPPLISIEDLDTEDYSDMPPLEDLEST